MKSLTVWVDGTPRAQGSMVGMRTKNNKIHLRHASKRLPEWRNAVVDALEAELATLAEDGFPWVMENRPYSLNVDFYMPRPKSHTKKDRLNEWRHQTPDLDKLVRAVCDALEIAKVVKDDARIVHLRSSKSYGPDGQSTGAMIRLSSSWTHPDWPIVPEDE